ncbi:MAG: ABC transporter ATP-binding protein [Actinobacteria bacterium]|nr:MAG: ABC transporter ATP-binding protein [Actinomycetota bacterium]
MRDNAGPGTDGHFDVELRSVTKRFGSHAAVDEVSLQVRNGEFLSLLGPSGCGKTTTLRLISGSEQPDEGEVLIGGVNAVGIPPYRRDVNTVFQQYALFPHMSILDNVSYGLKQRKLPKNERYARGREALELVQLRGRDPARPAQLSGGQQQRVALARALVMSPRVLLLDEPLGALDLKLRKEMQIELKRIQQQVGITFVYVTHDQGEALSMSDRIAVMSNGKIEQLGDPREIYDRPRTAFVADFIGDMNFLEGVVVEASNGSFAADAGGAIVIRGRGTAASGEKVRLGIRPERLVAHPYAPREGANVAAADVVTKMYLGDQLQLVAKLGNGVEVVVREQRVNSDPALDNLHPGDRIIVEWDETAPFLLSGPPATPIGQESGGNGVNA